MTPRPIRSPGSTNRSSTTWNRNGKSASITALLTKKTLTPTRSASLPAKPRRGKPILFGPLSLVELKPHRHGTKLAAERIEDEAKTFERGHAHQRGIAFFA